MTKWRVLAGLLAMGCAATPDAGSSRPGPDEPSDPIATGTDDPPATPDALRVAHSARTAARIVTGMPEVRDPDTRREIALHATLYRAAYDTNVGDVTRHYVLEPQPAGPIEIDLAEFRLRVLARLADLGMPIAWSGSDPDSYPGTRQLATRLGFRIEARSDQGRRVRGRIVDTTAHVGSSRQQVTAFWDGAGWAVERDGVRLVY